MRFIMEIAFCLTFLLSCVYGYEECKSVEPAGVDVGWLRNTKILYAQIHSNCDNCKPNEAFKWMSGRGLKDDEKLCWLLYFDTKWGPFKLPFNCKYADISEQQCEVDTSGTTIKNQFGMKAEIVITKTDNKTYIAGTNCIFGKENIWWMASIKKTENKKTKDDIVKFFVGLGFKPNNVAVKNNWKQSPVIFKKISLSECDSEEQE